MDNIVRLDCTTGRQPAGSPIDPNAVNVQSLRAGDVGMQVVAHHPSIRWKGIESVQGVRENSLVRLASTELAFNHNTFKQSF